jgi:hypothetical protein
MASRVEPSAMRMPNSCVRCSAPCCISVDMIGRKQDGDQLFATTAVIKAARLPALNSQAIGLAKFSVNDSPVLFETKIRGFSGL